MAEVNQEMFGYGNVRSAIRDLFEYGNQRAKIVGRENVFDYSLGNPSVPAPQEFSETLNRLINEEDPVKLHGYTSAAGDPGVRKIIAHDLNSKYETPVKDELIYMTCGAAASLTITLKALTATPDDEFIAIAPFFPEYRVFTQSSGAKFVVVPAEEEHFYINFPELKKAVNPHTKGIIINSPNNPTGAIFPLEVIRELCDFLRDKEAEYGHSIYIISDEPYRELVYDETTVLPKLPDEYDDTIICYSFSKSLSLPGERIGYIMVNSVMQDAEQVFTAIAGAGRALGFVCAPSMMQKAVAEHLGITSDLDFYKENRNLLYNALSGLGFKCIYPDGAFYLFVKAPGGDAKAFMEIGKKYEILMVPSDSFGVTGYVRLAYCVSTDMIKRSIPAFEKLAKEVL